VSIKQKGEFSEFLGNTVVHKRNLLEKKSGGAKILFREGKRIWATTPSFLTNMLGSRIQKGGGRKYENICLDLRFLVSL